jgi:hypothetical protein
LETITTDQACLIGQDLTDEEVSPGLSQRVLRLISSKPFHNHGFCQDYILLLSLFVKLSLHLIDSDLQLYFPSIPIE